MKLFVFAGALLACTAAQAQDHQGHDMANMPGMAQPAAASSAASMAGYSAAERAAGLREGRGMGLAMPAESNGYPGPRHVLEVADQLGLSAEQRARTQSLFDAMRGDAQRLELRNVRAAGERILLYFELKADAATGTFAVEGRLQDIAAELGLTREAFYRALAALERGGRIRREGRTIRLERRSA